jgi:hypothetical protein
MATAIVRDIGGRKYTARCLSVKEVREVLQKSADRKPGERLDLVEYLIEDCLPKDAFYLSLGLAGEADLDGIEDPADIVALMELVAEANPTFAGADKRSLARIKDQVSLLQNLKRSVPTL